MKRALVAALLCCGATAQAYVRTRSDAGTPVYWPSGCVYVQADSGGTQDLPFKDVAATIQRAMGNWQTPAFDCSYLQLVYQFPAAPLEAHYDGKNIVKFRADKWCHPEDAQSHNMCWDPAATAITTVFFADQPKKNNDGVLLDADVELNDLYFTFAILPTTTKPRYGTDLADLENTLTHEFGHLQGLDHSCSDIKTPLNETDDTGAFPLSCQAVDELPDASAHKSEVVTATMYPVAMQGEIGKRTPEADDVAGICNAYPVSADPKTCAAPSLPGGCELAGRGHFAGAWILMFLLGVALVRRRAPGSQRRFALSYHSRQPTADS